MHRSHHLAASHSNRRSVCPLCACAITRRETNHLLTYTHRHAIGRDDVVVEEATCQSEHIWMEVYDKNVLTAAWSA
jgi:hypothetical protein